MEKERIIIVGTGATSQMLAKQFAQNVGNVLIVENAQQARELAKQSLETKNQFEPPPIPITNPYSELTELKAIGPYLTGKQKRNQRRKQHGK